MYYSLNNELMDLSTEDSWLKKPYTSSLKSFLASDDLLVRHLG